MLELPIRTPRAATRPRVSLDRQMYEKMVRTTANFAERPRSSVARPAGGSSCTRSNLPCIFLRQVDALGFGGAARSGACTARYLS